MMVELGTRCATERAQVGNSPPKVARAWALLDPGNPTHLHILFVQH
jgi:hypothetical protein